MGEYDKAIADCDEAIRLDPNCVFAYNNRALAWCAKKQYDKAIDDYGSGNSARSVFRRGVQQPRIHASTAKRNTPKSSLTSNKQMRFDPSHVSIYQYAGPDQRRFLLAACPEEKIRNADKAIKIADKSLDCDPSDGHAMRPRKRYALASCTASSTLPFPLEGAALLDARFRADNRTAGGGHSQERIDAWKQKRPWFFTRTN